MHDLLDLEELLCRFVWRELATAANRAREHECHRTEDGLDRDTTTFEDARSPPLPSIKAPFGSLRAPCTCAWRSPCSLGGAPRRLLLLLVLVSLVSCIVDNIIISMNIMMIRLIITATTTTTTTTTTTIIGGAPRTAAGSPPAGSRCGPWRRPPPGRPPRSGSASAACPGHY